MSSYTLQTAGVLSLNAGSYVEANELVLSRVLAQQYGGSGYDLTDSESKANFLNDVGAQPASQSLTDLTNATPSTGQALVYNGTNWVASTVSGSTGSTGAIYYSGQGTNIDGSNAINVLFDNTTIDLNGSGMLEVKNGAVGYSKLNAYSLVDDTTVGWNGSNQLAVKKISGSNITNGSVGYTQLDSSVVDNSTVGWNGSNQLSVKQIGSANLSAGAVLASALGQDVVDGTTCALTVDNKISVAPSGVGYQQLNSSAFGSGLSGGSSSQVAVDFTRVFDKNNNQTFNHNLTLGNTSGYFTVASTTEFQNNVQCDYSLTCQGNLALQGKTISAKPAFSSYTVSEQFEESSTDATSFTLASVGLVANNLNVFSGCVSCLSDDYTVYGAWNIQAGVVFDGTTPTSFPNQNVSYLYKTDSSLDVSLSVDGSNNFKVSCVGKSATNLRWFVELTEQYSGKA